MPHYYDFEISLNFIKPRIWRRFLLSADNTTFLDLHRAIQDSAGWWDYHLWDFRSKNRKILAQMPDQEQEFEDEEWGPDASEVKLGSYFKKPKTLCAYTYDYGDHWEHTVKYHGIVEIDESFFRRLLDGDRAFPPEDCGGEYGYFECVDAVCPDQPAHDEYEPGQLESRREWLPDGWRPDAFALGEAKKEFDAASRDDVPESSTDEEDVGGP